MEQSDNCTQYSDCSSCLHFFGCIWCIDQCIFYVNIEGASSHLSVSDCENCEEFPRTTSYSFVPSRKCFSSGYNYFNHDPGYITFYVSKSNSNEIHFPLDIYYGLCPRLPECKDRTLSLSKGKTEVNLTFNLPQYANCYWIIKTERGSFFDESEDFNFTLLRQGNLYDKLNIRNYYTKSKYDYFLESLSYLGVAPFPGYDKTIINMFDDEWIAQLLRKVKFETINNEDIPLILYEINNYTYQTIYYEYFGPPFQNKFYFSISILGYEEIQNATPELKIKFAKLDNSLEQINDNNLKLENQQSQLIEKNIYLENRMNEINASKLSKNESLNQEIVSNKETINPQLRIFDIMIIVYIVLSGLAIIYLIIKVCSFKSLNYNYLGKESTNKNFEMYFRYSNLTDTLKKNQPECLICSATFEDLDNIVSISCNHIFHYKCIVTFFDLSKGNPFCPGCKLPAFCAQSPFPGQIMIQELDLKESTQLFGKSTNLIKIEQNILNAQEVKETENSHDEKKIELASIDDPKN